MQERGTYKKMMEGVGFVSRNFPQASMKPTDSDVIRTRFGEKCCTLRILFERGSYPQTMQTRSVSTSAFPNTYLVLMAQTTLDEWFGLYSSNTRGSRCSHSSGLRGFPRQRPNQGTKVVGRRSKEQVPCCLDGEYERDPYPYRDNLHPLRRSATPVRKRLRARRRAR